MIRKGDTKDTNKTTRDDKIFQKNGSLTFQYFFTYPHFHFKRKESHIFYYASTYHRVSLRSFINKAVIDVLPRTIEIFSLL